MRNKYSQNIAIASGKYNRERDYWLSKLSGDLNITGFPLDGPRTKTDTRIGTIAFQFAEDVAQKIIKMSKASEYAVYMFLLAGVKYLLHKYTRSEQLLVASPILKPKEDAEYLNHMLVLRTLLTKEMTFKEWIIQVRQTVGEANENPNYPIDKIIEQLQIPIEEGRFPLADVLVLLENIHEQSDLSEEGFDTVFSFLLEGGLLSGKLIYNANLFTEATIHQIITHLQRFFDVVTATPDIKLSDIEILSDEEKQQQLVDFNATQSDYPRSKMVYQLFEEQVEKTPGQIALVFEGQQVTYRELNQKANQLARVLRERGVKADQIVGLMADRSVEMVVGLLGILKAGGAYLPIDPEYPVERIRYILTNSQVNLLLTQSHYLESISFEGELIDLEDQQYYVGEQENLECLNTPNDLAYVIYTSGSTGQPKGVLIHHQGLVNYVTWASKVYLHGEKWNFPLYSSLSFDLTVTSIYLPLITGNQIIIYGNDEKEILIAKIIKEDQVQIIKLTPAHLQLIKEMDLDKSHIQAFIVGGEELKTELASQIHRKYHGNVKIYNEYGPTETVVGCMIYQYNPVQDQGRTVPIGVPADNVQIYLLDEDRRPVATGVSGEIYISGDGVARGYLQQPSLTEERFVQNPFIPEQRMYKTGDLARRLADGNIEFIGRMDHQVKIRGYRIELGEIERQLLQRSDVEEAVVIDHQDDQGDKTLCAYLVGQAELDISAIKEDLAKVLPSYMIPTHFIVLDQIPLTSNGKVDRRALPDPAEICTTALVAPRNSIEAQLLEIWKRVLNKDEISVTANFFEIGGHSLKATQLMALIYKEMNVEFSLMEIFESSTIEALAEAILEKEESTYVSIEPVEEREYYPLSSAQKRLFVLNQLDKDNLSYNIPFLITIESGFNQERFEDAINQLVQRHEALRTSFHLMDGEPVQKIDQNLDFLIQYHDVHEEELPTLVKSFVRPFDLAKAPLLRVELAKYGDRYLLMMDMHHIISDGVSMDILFSDFVKLYHSEELAPLRIQYKDFAVWQNDLLESERIQDMETYWVERFAGELPILNLPTDFPRPAVKGFEGDNISFALSQEVSEKLYHLAVETGSTLFMVLLAAYHVLLAQSSGQNDLVVGTPIAGRLHADLEGVIGMFLNTLPLRNQLLEGQTFAQFLEDVKINTLMAYENQEYQFEMLVDKLEIPRNINRMPLFDVMFVLQNMDQSEKHFSELTFAPYQSQDQTAKLDLNLFGYEINNVIQFSLNYSTSLFERKTVESMVGRFVEILTLIADNANILISEMTRPSEQEKTDILTVFGENLVMDEIETGSLQEQFYQIVDQYPDKVAIEYGQKSITYQELDQQSNRIANWLITKGYQQGSHLGILLEDRIQFITLILASIKSGCVFIPIDSAYPVERISVMVQNVDLAIIFTDLANEALVEEIFSQATAKPEIILLEPWVETLPETMTLERPTLRNHPDANAYIYFTSGSTGKPKGVLGRYKSLLHFICWEIKTMQVTADFRTTQFASPGFDALLRDLFVPICAGGTLCIPETRDLVLDINRLVNWLEESRINLIHCVPSVFRSFNLYPLCSKNVPDLKYILMAGEKVNPGDLKHWYDVFGGRVQLVNFYGPTETTLIKTAYFIQKEDHTKRTIPIGKPMEGARILIADAQLSPCKPGVIGEIYIRTPYMSLGYTDPDLTRERFIQNPYSNQPGDLMYRTGDLGRWMPDGNIEFIGRSDNQVKIHGVRVELGDIENQILHYDSIKEVVVVDREGSDGDTYLVAYFVADQAVSTTDLRKYLLLRLPEFMLPLYYVQLDQFPLNPHGKVDRKALPEVEAVVASSSEYVAPQNPLEEKLTEIWSKLLGLEKIGIHDNFFEIGGHSLKATSLAAKVSKEFSVELPLREIFLRPTIQELAGYIAKLAKTDYASIEPVELREYYPVSSAQKRLYVLNKLEENSLSYNMPFVMKIEGELDQERLEKAFYELIKRHDSLRTSFHMIDGEVVQKISEDLELTIQYIHEPETGLSEVSKEFIRPFDLSKAPLCRVGIVKGESGILLMIDVHHIVSDHFSQGIIFRELIQLYHGESLPELRIQYKDFAVWQNQLLQSERMKKQEEFWTGMFAGEIPVLNLPTDHPRHLMTGQAGDVIGFALSNETKDQLKQLANENGMTLHMTLLALYNVLLAKYTHQDDIVVGIPTAGRKHSDLENVIGMFVNTLPMRNHPNESKTLAEFLQEVKENSLNAYENQDYQFEMIVDRLKIQRDLERNPLFDVMFDMHIAEKQAISLEQNLKFKPFESQTNAAKFDITLDGTETGNGIFFTLEYNTDLFERKTMERMAKHLINIIDIGIKNPAIQIAAIDMASEEEKQQLLFDFNRNTISYPKDKAFHQLFEEQVEKTPDDIAVVFREERLTYRELNQKANQLARVLRNKGVTPNQMVGVMVERSLEMIIGVLGIMKAGGAYVPIDPDYPKDRIAYMIEDSNAKILLKHQHLLEEMNYPCEVLYFTEELYDSDTTNLENVNQRSDLVYVVYTSGSTGRPKGVLIQHDQYVNVAFGWRAEYHLQELKVNLLQMASFSFDVFAGDLARTLINGGKMVICPPDVRINYPTLYSLIREHAITLFEATPSLVVPFMEYVYANQLPIDNLKLLILGSDICRIDNFKTLLQRYGNSMRIINSYGASEATIDTSYYEEPLENIPVTGNVPIGKPLPNMTMYVFDRNMHLLPIGVYGELFIGGDSVARGYLNRPELNAERFIPNPYIPGERIYKTGDVVRWLPDGNMEFEGRNDNQVKIRGYRIELGEIENQLLTHPAIKEVAVVDRVDPTGTKYLCGYVATDRDISLVEIREYLANELPDYMIPAHFVKLDKMPLTPNGKIDRKSLPAPDGSISTGVEYVAPRNEIEERLTEIFSALLAITKVGINDNFFEIGGHSLSAMQLVGQVEKEFHVELPLREVFVKSTVKELAQFIREAETVEYNTIQPAEPREYYPVSSAQKRLYLMRQLIGDGIEYNMPSAWAIQGDLEWNRLEYAVKELVRRHESLRTSFDIVNGEIVQRVHQEVDCTIPYTRISRDQLKARMLEFIKPFDLAQAPLFRIEVVATENETVLLLDMHHTISDGLSDIVLIREFAGLYTGQTLPEMRLQYKDFAVWQNAFFQTERFQKQRNYWLERFTGEIPLLQLPTDHPRESVKDSEGKSLGIVFDEDVTTKINALIADKGITLYMFLLSVCNVLLWKYSGQNDIIIGTPISGRFQADLENMIGVFVNTLPMRNYPHGDKQFGEFLDEIKDTTLTAYENQDYPLDLLVEELKIKRASDRNPLFDVVLDLQNWQSRSPEQQQFDGLQFRPVGFDLTVAKFDLRFGVTDGVKKIYLGIDYKANLFEEETIANLLHNFSKIVETVVDHQDVRLSEIKLESNLQELEMVSIEDVDFGF